MSNLHLKLRYLQEQLNMNDSEFYWFLKMLNYKGIITTTDIVEQRIKYEEVTNELDTKRI